MSETPDLDKARELLRGFVRALSDDEIADLILEQRAEEAERAHMMIHAKEPGGHQKRAADLRRQAGGK